MGHTEKERTQIVREFEYKVGEDYHHRQFDHSLESQLNEFLEENINYEIQSIIKLGGDDFSGKVIVIFTQKLIYIRKETEGGEKKQL